MNNEPFITITEVVRGFVAVLVVWDEELDSYIQACTGFGDYATAHEAVPEALAWAQDEELALSYGHVHFNSTLQLTAEEVQRTGINPFPF